MALSERIGKIVFLLSLAFLLLFLAFVYGLGVGWAKIWPYASLRAVVGHAQSLYLAGEWQPKDRFVWAPPGAARQRVVVHKPELFVAGYRAIMGWNGRCYAIWLFDDALHQIHYWPIDYRALDSDGPSNGCKEPHGMKVLEDGSVLVNFDGGEILARLDACGHPIWLKHGVYHHSIDRAEDDTFWTWRADHNAYEQYQYLVNLDAATGDTIREYSLIDDFIKKSPEQSLIFGVSDDYRYNPAGGPDLFHPNDIEPLHSAVADQFPDFRPGDLLVSIRNIHLVAVLDPIDKRVKWWSHGPWRFQHDPDFTPDGKILIYSNNTDRQHSSIISIDPKSRQVDVAGTRFYSGSAGKLQRLPNSATLLVVPDEGRVLEATWSGDLIFEFNNIWSDQVNAYVVNAAWLPATFFNETPSCHAEKVSP